MDWAALIAALAALVKALSVAAPILAVWLANRAGKKQGRADQIAEDNAVAGEAQAQYHEIELEDRSEGPWLKG